jgi:hypothetical protein
MSRGIATPHKCVCDRLVGVDVRDCATRPGWLACQWSDPDRSRVNLQPCNQITGRMRGASCLGLTV